MQIFTLFKLLSDIAELNCHSLVSSFLLANPKRKPPSWVGHIGVDFTLHNCLGLRGGLFTLRSLRREIVYFGSVCCALRCRTLATLCGKHRILDAKARNLLLAQIQSHTMYKQNFKMHYFRGVRQKDTSLLVLHIT